MFRITLFVVLAALSAKAAANCEGVLTPEFMLFGDRQTDHTEYVRQLEAKILELTAKSRFRLRPTQLRGAVKYESMMFNLAGGKSQQVIDMVKVAANDVEKSYRHLSKLGPEIKKLHTIDNLSRSDRDRLDDLEAQFVAHSQAFGENYGFVKNAILLLESVSKKQGVPRTDLLANHTLPGSEDAEAKPAELKVVLDLTTPRAVEHAARALGILRSNGLPEVAKLKEMFSNNSYALRAKLERDLAELEKWNRPLRKLGLLSAFTVMNGTELIPKISETMRVHIMQALGLQVRRFMFNLYLGQIQDVVNVARVRTSDGKLVLLSDERTMRDQIKELIQASHQSIGEDLLVTFARISYHRDSWNNIMEALEKMSGENTHDGREMKLLYDRLKVARETARKLGDMAYVHEPNDAFELQLLIGKVGWIAGMAATTKYVVFPAGSKAATLFEKIFSLFM